MIKYVCMLPRIKGLGCGPLGPHMDGYVASLLERGYAHATIMARMRGVCVLTLWMEKTGRALDSLDEDCLRKFCKKHASHPAIKWQMNVLPRDLLEYLRKKNLIAAATPVPERPLTSEELLIVRFEKYLREERGLQPSTVCSIVPTARLFLQKRVVKKEVSFAQLKAGDVVDFMVRHVKGRNPSTAGRIASSLRTFCRFLHSSGETQSDLSAAVPSVADWPLSKLPKHLEPDQVEALLQTCDRGTPLGKRDYAILLVLSRLGLRAGEVAHMRLEDIDWERGEISVDGKSERQARLPLPDDVGKALVDYLVHGRVENGSPFVFLRLTAPYGGFEGPSGIGGVVRRALDKAGIEGFGRGAHLLRHTLAKRMLEEKSTLFEISEVLRHKDLKTTAIYAKLDTDTLHALAQPWPGGVR